jgi:hypothetical protein
MLVKSRGCWYLVGYIVVGVGRNSSVGKMTRYGLDGPGIESQCCEIIHAVQTGPGSHPASYTMGTGSLPGVKQLVRCIDHHPHLAPGLKKE